jgi:hypothetical protein
MTAKNICWLYLSAACILASAAAAPIPQEYQVKAALIFNLAKFVEWPANALPEMSPRMALCLLGEDPFGAELEQTVAGKLVNGKELVIRRFRAMQDLSGCHIVFISASEKKNLPEILGALQSSHALTVGEIGQFAEMGGMINLITENNRVQFEVNVEAVERANLKISSKALKLAKVIRGGEKS